MTDTASRSTRGPRAGEARLAAWESISTDWRLKPAAAPTRAAGDDDPLDDGGPREAKPCYGAAEAEARSGGRPRTRGLPCNLTCALAPAADRRGRADPSRKGGPGRAERRPLRVGRHCADRPRLVVRVRLGHGPSGCAAGRAGLGLDSDDWTTRTGRPGLDDSDWTTRTRRLGLDE